MKTAGILTLLLLVGLFGVSCSTVDRFNAEYEEELALVETMSPAEKAEWETAHGMGKIDWARNFESE